MSTYKVAEGFYVADADLVDIDPQPTSLGVQYTRRTWSGDTTINAEGPYCELHFNVLQDETEYQSLLAQFGIDDSLSAQVTVSIRDATYNFLTYNAIAIQPDPGKDNGWEFFPKNIVILLRNLEHFTP